MEHSSHAEPGRRDFLRGALGVAALGAVGGVAPSVIRPSRALAAAQPISMAMHIHASFSEGAGSMEGHLSQAVKSGIDVVWWSDHDSRLVAHGAQEVVHFDGPSETSGGTTWSWTGSSTGSLTLAQATFVSSPTSPNDPSGTGALRLQARSNDASFARRRMTGKQNQELYRTSVDGTTLRLDVRPVSTGSDAWLGLVVKTSRRPARGGRPAGQYQLEYRVGGPYPVGTRIRESTVGVVTLSAPPGQWTTVVLDPVADLEAIWPGVDGRDASLYQLEVVAASRNGATADGYVDFLRLSRVRKSGAEALAVQGDIMAGYATQFPSVKQHQALEVSTLREHLGWYGGNLSLPPMTVPPGKKDVSVAAFTAKVDAIHAAGGVVSYNHPFGTPARTLTAAEQTAARRAKATELIGAAAYGCDLLEVGYPFRAGLDLEHYLGLWDALSRNAIFLTGTGVSDDHSGLNWLGQRLNFWTWVWATSTARDVLASALRAGRSYCGNPAVFRGELDLVVDGSVLMGQVAVAAVASRSLRIAATDVPSGGRVDLIRGLVDLAGPSAPDPVVSRTSLAASAFAGGYAEVTVDTSQSRFVRVEVRDAAGTVVAVSNPVWLLRSAPPGGVPVSRQA